MATYNTVVSEVLTKLNRDDCTTQLAQYFVNDAIRSIQRSARLPCMERSQIITCTGPSTAPFITVPVDLLKIKRVLGPAPPGCPDPYKPLAKKDYDFYLSHTTDSWPWMWAREQSQIWLGGPLPVGTSAKLVYWGEFTPILPATGQTDPGTGTNELFTSAPDLVVWKALSFAGMHFEHPRTDAWEANYQSTLSDVQEMAEELDLDGGPMELEPIYGWDTSSGWRS